MRPSPISSTVSYAIAATADARYADIVDGKLYLFVNAPILAKYKEDPKRVIAGAVAKRPEIVHTPVNEL